MEEESGNIQGLQHNEIQFFRDCGSIPVNHSEYTVRGTLDTDETDSKAGADETANS